MKLKSASHEIGWPLWRRLLIFRWGGASEVATSLTSENMGWHAAAVIEPKYPSAGFVGLC